MGERISSYVSPFKHKDSISRFSEAIEKFRKEKAENGEKQRADPDV